MSDPGVTLLERGKPLAKPPVRALAKQLGIDLRSVRGTGPEGSVTREDLQGQAEPAAAPRPVAGPPATGRPGCRSRACAG